MENRSNSKITCRSAFTLIELIVVISILAVVGATIGACLFAGIRVLDRSKRFTRIETEVYTGFALFEKDLLNTMSYDGYPFRGDGQELSFALLVPSGDAESADSDEWIGASRYQFQREQKRLLRRKWSFPGDDVSGDVGWEDVMSGIKLVRFEYYMSPEQGFRGGQWTSTWDSPTNVPLAVRMNVRIEHDGARFDFHKTIVIPAAQ